MELVEQARREQIATSGVVHGGATANFLRADEARGEALIESLVGEEAHPAPVHEGAETTAEAAHEEVLSDLLAEEPAPTTPKEPGPVPEAPADVDTAVIEDLLGDKAEEKE